MDLPEIGQTRLSSHEIAMAHESPGMGITFDTMASYQLHALADGLAKSVAEIGS
jgi:hypothetical protein